MGVWGWGWAQTMQGLIGHLEGSGPYAQYDESSRDRALGGQRYLTQPDSGMGEGILKEVTHLMSIGE